jgi:hypothetical protein
MQKKVVPVKEISTIEGVLHDAPVGILAFRMEDNIVQRTRTFIYIDKNIYIFYGQGEEEFKKIKFGWNSSFSILKNIDSEDSEQVYKILSITVTGRIRPIEEKKLFDEVGKQYLKKYKWRKSDLSHFSGSVMIDTEEIQAYEETGG